MRRALKVLVFTTVFPNGAQPVHGLFVAERLRHLARRAELRVVAPVAWFRRRRPGRAVAELQAVHPAFCYLPGLLKCADGFLLFASALPAIRAIRRQFEFDLIDAHFGYPDGVAAVLLGRWFRRPVTITLRGSELDMARSRSRAVVMRWAIRRTARVIAVSPELGALALRLGARPDVVDVIGNGVDTARFRPLDRAAVRRALGIEAGTKLIVTVGHLASIKRFDTFLDVLQMLVREQPDVRFVIVGGPAAASGAYPKQLLARIDRLRPAGVASVTGPVPPAVVADWLNAADLFVLTSRREGSSNAIREALACGCPLVAGDVGDVRATVPAACGIVVAADADSGTWRDAVLSALGRRWDREAIRAHAATLSWTAVAERVLACWHEAAEERPGAYVATAGRETSVGSGGAA